MNFRIAIITLVSALALQQTWGSSNIVNLAFNRAEVASSQYSQKNVSLGRKNVAIGGGGYVTGIYLHPRQQNLVYIKTDVGGFYRWNPNAQSWMPITDHFSLDQSNYYGGEALALDPNNSDIVYIAAGKYTADWWSHRGSIFKSTDKGETWTKLNIDLKMGGNEHLRWVGERLAVNPFNSNIIFFGSRQDGLWKSSDAGATWSKVLSFPGKPTKDIGITAIAFNKQVSGLVYAIAYGDGIYESTDTGVTWKKITGSPLEAKRMTVGSNGVIYVTHSSGVSKYANRAWSNITPLDTKGTFNALSVNPTNPNYLLVTSGETQHTKIYQSINGGTTWIEKKKFINSTVPWWSKYMLSNPWIAAIEFDPKVAGRVWFTDWYGIWRTENINANPVAWTNYEKGHEEVVTFTLASPPRGALLLSGSADVDGFYHDKGLDTYPSKMFGSNGPSFQDTYSIAYCETDPSRMVRVGGNRWNNTYTGATSKDGGRSWQQFVSFPANTMPTRVAMSATDPNLFVVTVSGGQPLRTTNSGVSWERVSGLPEGFKGPWNWSQPLAADKVDGNTFYYYANGKVYRSTDGGSSFRTIDASSLPSVDWHSLKTAPGVKGELWLSLDSQGLYHSTNDGKTFSRIAGVKKAYLFALGKPQVGSKIPALYLYGNADVSNSASGSEETSGIFRSLDRGKTWISIGDRSRPLGNQPNVMEASRQQFGLVFIGTNGRGISYGTP